MVVSKRLLSGAQPEIRNMGFVWGVWGLSPHPPKTDEGLRAKPPAARGQGWGLGAKPPALKNFAFFCKNNLNLRLF